MDKVTEKFPPFEDFNEQLKGWPIKILSREELLEMYPPMDKVTKKIGLESHVETML